MLAHIAGVPFEEWLAPLATTGGGIAVALRLALRRLHGPRRATAHPHPDRRD
jgi:hypothetical protein